MAIVINQISDSTVRYLQRRLLAWGRDNFSDFPWRHESNRFHALVAEVLLQRTRAEQVVPVYREFKERFPDSKSLAGANISDIERVIGSLGLRWRARFLSELGKQLDEAEDRMPTDVESLRRMHGVGPYAAAAYLSLHAGKHVPIVDSNVVRFYGRFFGFHTGPETRREKAVLQLADRITPMRVFRDFNYALIDFTRAICRPRPHHEVCPVAGRCSLLLQHLSLTSDSEKNPATMMRGRT